MISTNVEPVWPLRDVLAISAILAGTTFWILRKRSRGDVLALLLAALTFVIVLTLTFAILNPTKSDWRQFVIYESAGWVAGLIVWLFNRLFKARPSSGTDEKTVHR